MGLQKSHQKAMDIFSWPINLSILIVLHGPWIQWPHEKTMNYNIMKFMAFSMPLKGHEQQPKSFKVFLWIFHGFAQNLRVFMAHENWKIKGFLMAFWMFFFFHAFSRVTCHEKSYKISHENTIKILWKSCEVIIN